MLPIICILVTLGVTSGVNMNVLSIVQSATLLQKSSRQDKHMCFGTHQLDTHQMYSYWLLMRPQKDHF